MKQYTGWHFTASAIEGRDGWPLQRVEELPPGTKPVLCQVGLHASKRALDALSYAPGPFVSRVRLEGQVVVGHDKACATRRVRLAGPVDVSRELRLFACRCAERVLPIFERARPGDTRPREAIAVARRFAEGEATREEAAAARNAAWDAARDAAWDAARAAGAARDAAWDAARAAATAAGAAWDAGGAARAAGAARDAAWDAARAAATAAGAARDAAWDAARAAATAAERAWQERELARVLRAALEGKE